MGYLYQRDYLRQIQLPQLNQLIGSDQSILSTIEATATEEANSYLLQKYDTAYELTDMQPWSYTATYKAQRRFYLFAATYVPANNYVTNDIVEVNSKVYILTANKTGAWNTNNTTLLGSLYDIFFANPPQPVWDAETVYVIGNQVWWHDKVYTCLNPYAGIAPDDPQAKPYWGNGTAYQTTANTLPTNTTVFTQGDNRSQQLVLYVVNIVLYYASKRIAPQNIPANILLAYDNTINWLIAASGDNRGISANIPRLQPKQGYRTRMGSLPRNVNNY
jgi:hypothetical protein